jgi:Uma2 family endonuclease
MATRVTSERRAQEHPETPPVRRRRFTVEEYHKMAEAGILHEADRVELIEGEILQLSPIGNRHSTCVRRLVAFMTRAVGDTAIVDVQNPVRLPNDTEPQPDLALLKPRDDFYATAHPGPDDVLLLVEVSDTTIQYDRGEKLGLYARVGIPEYWIVDLTSDRLEVYSRPVSGEYRDLRKFGHGETVASNAIPSLSLAADDVLGPPASS